MKTSIALAAALLLSNCSYNTYVVPKPTVARKPTTSTSKYGGTTHSSTHPDSFQAVTKPSTYSR
jgi:hypothetical protein